MEVDGEFSFGEMGSLLGGPPSILGGALEAFMETRGKDVVDTLEDDEFTQTDLLGQSSEDEMSFGGEYIFFLPVALITH